MAAADWTSDDRVAIACCPRHGLHGARDTCFECGEPVEQVEIVPLDDRLRELLRWVENYGEPEEWAKRAQAAHARAERLLVELTALRDASPHG